MTHNLIPALLVEVAEKIQAQGVKEDIAISTLNGTIEKKIRRYSNITITGYLSDAKTTISAYEQDSISCRKEQLPTSKKALQMSHLSHLADKLAPDNLDIPVGLLIGADCPQALTSLRSVSGGPRETFAVETFGWTLCGGAVMESSFAKVKTFKTSTTRDEEVLKVLE